jgi:hypothetical protein
VPPALSLHPDSRCSFDPLSRIWNEKRACRKVSQGPLDRVEAFGPILMVQIVNSIPLGIRPLIAWTSPAVSRSRISAELLRPPSGKRVIASSIWLRVFDFPTRSSHALAHMLAQHMR